MTKLCVWNQIVHVNFKQCYRYEAVDGKVVRTFNQIQLCPTQEEAGTKMIYNLCDTEELKPPYNAVVQCSDTYVLMIMMNNMKL